MEACDVCKIEFQSATPNVAVGDGRLVGGGIWAFVCEGHAGRVEQFSGLGSDQDCTLDCDCDYNCDCDREEVE